MSPTSFDVVYQLGLPLRWLVYANWEDGRWFVGAHYCKERAKEKIESEYRYMTQPSGIIS